MHLLRSSIRKEAMFQPLQPCQADGMTNGDPSVRSTYTLPHNPSSTLQCMKEQSKQEADMHGVLYMLGSSMQSTS